MADSLSGYDDTTLAIEVRLTTYRTRRENRRESEPDIAGAVSSTEVYVRRSDMPVKIECKRVYSTRLWRTGSVSDAETEMPAC